MKLTDYIAKFIADQGVRYVFGVTGGAVVHLFDSADKEPNLQPIFTHHEQAAAFAAQAYARVTNNLGAAYITTGPGGTNAITGLCAAWLDSIPCLFISGQTRIEHTVNDKPIRQLGSQHIDIISVVKSLTKYAVLVDDPKKMKYTLQKAVYLAKTGRPGPVWIDVPLNFQWLSIEPDELEDFDPQELAGQNQIEVIDQKISQCLKLIDSARRPIVVAGYGIRLGKGEKEFKEFIEKFELPFVCTWNTKDLLPSDHPHHCGLVGIAGVRGANFAVQNSDLVISLGSHLSLPLTGTDYTQFAREAKKIMVDIDAVELDFETVPCDLRVRCDVKDFLGKLLDQPVLSSKDHKIDWNTKCEKYKTYNVIPQEWFNEKEFVNPYCFIDRLSDELTGEDTIAVDGGGTALYIPHQSLRTKEGQRMIVSAGIGAMGAGLPESIGACFGRDQKRTLCIIGDGSLQFNIHELQTIVHHQLPVKIIVFNNEGYLAIRHTQDGFLKSHYVGSGEKGGISMPDFGKVADAYGIKSVRIHNHSEMEENLKFVLTEKGPVVCEIMISPKQELFPRSGFKMNPDGTGVGMPLEDMCPFLERKEFLGNMIVEPLDVSREL